MVIRFDSLEVMASPTSTASNDGQTHNCKWFAEVDTVTCADHVLAMAQRIATASFAPGSHYVPQFGDVFATEAGLPVVGGVNEAWVNAQDDRYADFGAVCMQANTRPAPSARCNKKWIIDVSWSRPPVGRTAANMNVSPIDWATEYKVEYASRRTETEDGRIVFGGTVGTLQQMVNSVGDPLPPFSKTTTIAVLVARRNTPDPFAGAKVSQVFEDTVNNAPVLWQWVESGQTYSISAAKHCARFQSSRCSDRMYWRNIPYYQQVTRIEIAREPFYERRLNQGPRANRDADAANPLAEAGLFAEDSNGTPYGRSVPLDAGGYETSNPLEFVYFDYLLHGEADYSQL